MNHESQLVKSYPAKNWSNMWQALVIGCWAQFKAMGDDHICKKSQGRDEPTCSQGSLNGLVHSYPEKFGEYVNFEVT